MPCITGCLRCSQCELPLGTKEHYTLSEEGTIICDNCTQVSHRIICDKCTRISNYLPPPKFSKIHPIGEPRPPTSLIFHLGYQICFAADDVVSSLCCYHASVNTGTDYHIYNLHLKVAHITSPEVCSTL